MTVRAPGTPFQKAEHMPIDFDALVLGPCIGIFGQPAIYMPGTGGTVGVAGVFDEAFLETKFEGEAPVSNARPMLGVRASMFPGTLPVRGELFQIGGTINGAAPLGVGVTMTGGAYWSVIEPPHADGHGHLKIFLMLARNIPAP
jgi:hypothetical protein